MRVIEDVRESQERFPSLTLTIGSFDGIHLGHRLIIEELIRCARAANGTAALMTLHPHPRQFFAPESAPNILTTLKQKERILRELGLDVLYVLPFTAAVANLSPRGFVEEIIVGKCAARELVVGHDFAFGKGAAGSFEFLCEVGPEYGFSVRQVPALVVQGERVASTVIREKIVEGEMGQVEHLLGRPYSIVGEVLRGRGIGGTKLGYPTANIRPNNNAVPAHGVYAGEVLLDGVRRPAAINIGIAPTILQEDVTIEAFILDFNESIVGREIEVTFLKRLRPEKKFASLDELIRAIGRDVDDVRAYLGTRSRV